MDQRIPSLYWLTVIQTDKLSTNTNWVKLSTELTNFMWLIQTQLNLKVPKPKKPTFILGEDPSLNVTDLELSGDGRLINTIRIERTSLSHIVYPVTKNQSKTR